MKYRIKFDEVNDLEIAKKLRETVGRRKVIFTFNEKIKDEEEFQVFLKGMFKNNKLPFSYSLDTKSSENRLFILTKKIRKGFNEGEVSFYYQIINAYYKIKSMESF